MKVRFLPMGLAIGLLSVAAFALTKSDYDHSFKFSNFRTWDFKVQTRMPRDPVGTNSLWAQRIHAELEQQLTADGFKKVSDGDPSFLIAYYMGTKEKYDTRYINYGFPGRWGRWHGWGAGGGAVDVWRIPYTESTLVLDIIDPHTNTLIWRGYDTETVDFNKSDKSIGKAVDNLVKRFAHEVKQSEEK